MRVRPEIQALPAYRAGLEYADLLCELAVRREAVKVQVVP